jgi:hypothetical protein
LFIVFLNYVLLLFSHIFLIVIYIQLLDPLLLGQLYLLITGGHYETLMRNQRFT